jgi:hypothetical protein
VALLAANGFLLSPSDPRIYKTCNTNDSSPSMCNSIVKGYITNITTLIHTLYNPKLVQSVG